MRFSRSRYERLLRAVYEAENTRDKGRSLEDLIHYLMELIPGIKVIDQDANCGDEELDLILWNGQIHPTFRPWDSIILVECKNWRDPVCSSEINWFLTKMEERKLENGIFVAINGVTGNFSSNRGAKRLIINALAKKIRVIVVTGTDLQNIINRDSLCELLRDKYCGSVNSSSRSSPC